MRKPFQEEGKDLVTPGKFNKKFNMAELWWKRRRKKKKRRRRKWRRRDW
jgi:hypothetical protein